MNQLTIADIEQQAMEASIDIGSPMRGAIMWPIGRRSSDMLGQKVWYATQLQTRGAVSQITFILESPISRIISAIIDYEQKQN